MLQSVLDTDILSEYLKGFDAAVNGFELKAASTQLKKALAWLNQSEQITPIGTDFQTAAIIRATARRQGSVLEIPDCLIAAVAIRLDRTLVTGNTNDFEAIRKTGVNLTIENWRAA